MGFLDYFKKKVKQEEVGETSLSTDVSSSEQIDDWGDDIDWGDDLDWGMNDGDSFDPVDSFLVSGSSSVNDSKYHLEGYGNICDISEELMSNSSEVMKMLALAKDREQWLYILDVSRPEAMDNVLIDYLFQNHYTLEEYIQGGGYVHYSILRNTKLFYHFLKETLEQKNEENLIKLLSNVGFIDEKVLELFVSNAARNTILKENSIFSSDDTKKAYKAILAYEKERKVRDLSFVSYLRLDIFSNEELEELMLLGYEITDDSPYTLQENNYLVRKYLLKDYDQDVLDFIIQQANNKEGLCWKIYNFTNKKILTKSFIEVMGVDSFLQILKFIEIPNIVISLDKVVEDGRLEEIKKIYDQLNKQSSFSIDLFIHLVNLYEVQPNLVHALSETDISAYEEQLWLLFSLPDKSKIHDLETLSTIHQVIYETHKKEIDAADDVLLVKDVICRDLLGIGYLDVHKLLIECFNQEKLMYLRNSIQDEKKKEELDKYLHMSNFLEGLINNDNLSVLKKIAESINAYVHQSQSWVREIRDIRSEVMNFYVYEANEKMIDLYSYMTNKTYMSTTFTDSEGHVIPEQEIPFVQVPMGAEFNVFTHLINAFGSGGSIEGIKKPYFFGQSYACLCGITDEYCRLCTKDGYDEVIVLYNQLPAHGLAFFANRDIGISTDFENSKELYTRAQMNGLPFRRLVRSTKEFGSESWNEYDVYREGLEASGILVFGVPTERQKQAAAYLGVPLVNIEQVTEIKRRERFGVLEEEEYFSIKEHRFEEEKCEIPVVSKNDQFLHLFSSVLSTDTMQQAVSVTEIKEERDVCYQFEEDGVLREAVPTFMENETNRGHIRVSEMVNHRVKNRFFQEFLPGSDLNYQLRKVRMPDGKIVLAQVYDKVDYQYYQFESGVDATVFFKKVILNYLLNEKNDSLIINDKIGVNTNLGIFDDGGFYKSCSFDCDVLEKAYANGDIKIDFASISDFVSRLTTYDEEEYMQFFQDFLRLHPKISPLYLQKGILSRKESLAQEIEKFVNHLMSLREKHEDMRLS